MSHVLRTCLFVIAAVGPILPDTLADAREVKALAPPVGTEQTGRTAWYGAQHQGRRTASGARFDMYQLTAAHRTLPLGTRVRVTNLENGRAVNVRVNDRGPVGRGRILDLSYAAARALGAVGAGVVRVRLEVLAAPAVMTRRE
jgi:rare lipoprotein A